MRWLACICMAAVLGSCKTEDVYFIPGTATLPDCTETPADDLDGACLFDQGTVTILSTGCLGAEPDAVFASCALAWSVEQTGNDVTIIVDGEYRIEGRFCGDQLHLRGGWWLPVEDEGFCTYEDDSAEEVGIQAEGNVLTYVPPDEQNLDFTLEGTLRVQGPCAASYQVTLQPGGGCFFE